ncbi:MAG: DUF3794 domain-containing protein [Clostridia bacterium]|nr:DUF3794 domain-containing protein [Clostridia bacterium]
MIELNKENICIGEKSIALFSQAYCEASVIVPDVYPDIVKIIQISSTAGITDKKCLADKATVDGKAEIVILYLGDDEKVYSITTSQPFSHIIDAKGTAEPMYIQAEITVDSIDYTLLNTRKLNIKILMGIDANVTEDVNAEICTSLSTDEPYEVLNCTVSPYPTIKRTFEQLCIREKLDLPGGKPSIEKLLRTDVCIRNKEYMLSTDKMIIKGILLVSTVYCSDVDGKIHCAEHEVPFAETISMPDVTEDMDAKLKLCINRIFYKPEPDADGDLRHITIECIITADAKACKKSDTNIIKDIYCTKYPVISEYENSVITSLLAENSCQISAKDIVSLDEDSADISQVFNISPKAHLANARTEGNNVIIEGIIETDIMYVSDQVKNPVNTHRHTQQFSHTFEIPNHEDNIVCDVHIDIVHSSYTISMGKEIDLRFVLQLDTDVLASHNTRYIKSVKRDTENCYTDRKSYCIKIYFAKKCDSLWSIAKQHKISRKSLMEINNISSDSELFDGRQIMIPIK